MRSIKTVFQFLYKVTSLIGFQWQEARFQISQWKSNKSNVQNNLFLCPNFLQTETNLSLASPRYICQHFFMLLAIPTINSRKFCQGNAPNLVGLQVQVVKEILWEKYLFEKVWEYFPRTFTIFYNLIKLCFSHFPL